MGSYMVREVDMFALCSIILDLTVARAVEALPVAGAVSVAARTLQLQVLHPVLVTEAG